VTGALEGIRVVDLAGSFGNYCGKLFADLGADVILAERSGGAPQRAKPPLSDDGDSVWFVYENTGKRSVVVTDDNDLQALLADADVLIGNGSATWPTDWGLHLDELSHNRPDLVIVSISPFGLTGPYSGYEGTDLTSLSFGGLLWLGGYGDGAPTQAGGEQAIMGASAFAAVGGMLAVLHAERTGEGQLVDTSIQESVTMALENAAQFYDLQGTVRRRITGRQRGAGAGIYPCADGYVYLFVGGIASNRFWDRFIAWLREEDAVDVDRLTGEQWQERAYFDTDEAKESFSEVFESFSASRTREDLYREAQSRGIVLAPVRRVSEVVSSAQLQSRDFFAQVHGPHGLTGLAPGAPYLFSETPWSLAGAAPALGAHTAELLSEVSA
jgi:benzylsuccinate CoA-transferase BbsE subunit